MSVFTKHRFKTPTVLQKEATECGAACLAMILAYYGRYEPLEKLREECGVSRNGSKASLILKTARSYNLQAKGYRVLLDKIADLKAPLILFWEFNHFVVYEGQSKDGASFYLNDPAIGHRIIDRETFERAYTGIALEFKITPEFKTNAKPKGVFSSIAVLLAEMRDLLWLVMCGGVLLALPGLAIPILMQTFVDSVLIDKSNWLLAIILFFFLAVFLQIVLASIVELALRRAELKISVNKTIETINYLLQLPLSFFNQRGRADLQNRITLNSSIASTVFGLLATNLLKIFTAMFFLALMLVFSVKLTLITVAFMLIDLLFLWLIMNKCELMNQGLIAVKTKMLNSVLAGISSLESLKASGREDCLFGKWMDDLAEYNCKNLRLMSYTTYFKLIPACVAVLGNVAVLCCGALQVIAGELSLGGLFAFQTLMTSFIAPCTAILLSSPQLQNLKNKVDRLKDVYCYKQEDIFAPEPIASDSELIRDYAELTLKEVCYSYGKEEALVLKNFNLDLSPGKRVAIVGQSGSGKSTLAKLIAGVLKPTSGELLLNGKPYKSYTAAQFYAQVGIVDQTITMFSGSIEDNLTLFAHSYEPQDIFNAIKDAQIEDELVRRGSILNQTVAEDGANFSGGQSQRLEIARVLAYNTPLLILDEATSALDPITEQRIDLALRRRGVTTVIIAHRLSTIRDADEIIVLDKGEIIERGTHETLLASQGSYAKMMSLEGVKL